MMTDLVFVEATGPYEKVITENKLKNHKKSQLCSHEDKTLKIGYGLLIWAERDYKFEQVMGFQITTD